MTIDRADRPTGHLLDVLVASHAWGRAQSLATRLVRGGLAARAAEARSLQAVVLRDRPAVVVLDITGEDSSTWSVVMELCAAEAHRPQVVVVADEPESRGVDLCLVAGACTVVDADDADDALRTAVHAAQRGESGDPAVARRRREALRELAASQAGRRAACSVNLTRLETPEPDRRPGRGDDPDRSSFDALGPSQRDLVEGVVRGDTVAAIAEQRGVSPSAVYGARARLASRLDVTIDQLDNEIRTRFESFVALEPAG